MIRKRISTYFTNIIFRVLTNLLPKLPSVIIRYIFKPEIIFPEIAALKSMKIPDNFLFKKAGSVKKKSEESIIDFFVLNSYWIQLNWHAHSYL